MRDWFDVESQDLSIQFAKSFDLAQAHSVLVASAVTGGLAQQAGIQSHDVITRLYGLAAQDAIHALNVIARHQPGKCICVGGACPGQLFHLDAEIGQRPIRTVAEPLRPY